jgi:hypothetical protein
MRKFLFSFVAVLAFAGLFGLQGALSQSCTGNPGEGLICSGGGPFYGFSEDIFCWKHYLFTGGCAGSPAGTEFIFHDIESGVQSRVTLGLPE